MADNLEYLYTIQSQYSPCVAELPGAAKNTYTVELSTRVIDAPKSISVSSDHKAEVIYFVMDRYYDYMDLTNTCCMIQYVAPDNSPYVYVVPYYDIYTYRGLNKLVIPWNVDGAATQKKGKLTFSIRFFKIEYDENNEPKLVYNLNTLAAETEILEGLNVDPLNKEEVDFGTDAYEIIMHELSTLSRKGTYWEILD
jgi:hypothetical protein